MSSRQAFDWGALAGMLLMIGAQAGNWLITPMSHPHASTMQRCGVVIQALLGMGLGVWLFVRRRPPAWSGPAQL